MGSRAQNPCHLPFHQLPRPRLLDLITNGHLASRFQDLADVSIGGMVWDAAHGNRAALGQSDIEQLRSLLRIFEKQLVEISQPEQQQGVFGQLAFDSAILRHHRRELGVAGHQASLRCRRQANQFRMRTTKVGPRCPHRAAGLGIPEVPEAERDHRAVLVFRSAKTLTLLLPWPCV